ASSALEFAVFYKELLMNLNNSPRVARHAFILFILLAFISSVSISTSAKAKRGRERSNARSSRRARGRVARADRGRHLSRRERRQLARADRRGGRRLSNGELRAQTPPKARAQATYSAQRAT